MPPDHDPQPYLDHDAELSRRQQTLLSLCNQYGILIAETGTAAGEDSAAHFPTVRPVSLSATEPWQRFPVHDAPERYCVVTRHDHFHFVYPLFGRLRRAKQHAIQDIDDDIYAELPVVIVDLDTGKRWVPALTATWVPSLSGLPE